MAGSGQVVTFADYEADADRAARHLRSLDVATGDHVAIFSENTPRMLVAEAGAERAGVYFTLVNSYLSAEEVAYVVGDCLAEVLYTTVEKLPVAAAAVALLDDPVTCVLLDGGPAD